MVSITPKVLIIVLATVSFYCQALETSEIPEYGEGTYDYPEAEERIFHKGKKQKLAPLIEKKNWLLSLFTKHHQPEPEPEPVSVQTLTPVVNYPVWKVHKYKGIELYPVQFIDVPRYYQPVMFAPPVEPVRMPHTEYGPPQIEYGPQQFVDSKDTTKVPLETYQVPTINHGEKFRSLLSHLKTHKNLLWKIKNLKSWKLGLKQAPTPNVYPTGYAVELPEVAEVPVKGLEKLNVQVPELPPINLPYYASAITNEPYVSVNYASPLPYYSPVVNYEPPVRTPAPYYGVPPLQDSYGNPLPPDAYSSEPSNQILTIAVPDTASQLQPDISLRPPSAGSDVSFASTSLDSKAKVAKETPAEKPVKEEAKNATMPPEKESSGSQSKNRNPAEKESH